MAMLPGHFDATQVEPNAPRDIVPAGDYIAQIVKSDMNPTKDGTGQMLVLELEILDGPQTGRHIWDRLNLRNKNATAEQIAQQTLSAICHAVNVLSVQDSEALHFKPMMVKVNVLPAGTDSRGYERREPQNEVKGYKPAPGGAAAPAQHHAPAAAPAAAKPAWGAGAAATKPAPAAAAAPASAPWRRSA